MSVTIKQKEQSILESATELLESTDVAARVDIYGAASAELAARLAKLEPLTAMVTKLKATLVEEAAEKPAEEKVVLVGSDYEVSLSAKAKKVMGIDKKALRKALGKDTYFELAKVGVTDIRKYCTPPQLENILTEKKEGARTFKIAKT